MTNIELPAWKPRPDSEERKASAIEIAGSLLAARDRIQMRHLREMLKIAVWKYTECDGKYNTRYRTRGALGAAPDKVHHEHVIQIKALVDQMVSRPEKYAQILSSAIGCVTLRTEHRTLGAAEKNDPNLMGWDRYRAVGLEVWDLKTRERVI